jgi:amidohydrolase
VDIDKLKSQIISEIEVHRAELYDLSRKIHANPEPGFQEVKAAGWLAGFLEKNGFVIERGFCGLDTAFRASYGKGEPAIALLAEYDALADMGHACGHNLIATSSAGAGIGAKLAIDRCGGKVVVIGTPAEELYSGKQVLAERGAFSDLAAVMMAHPGSYDAAVTEALACQGLNVEFFGKAAHAAGRPEAGINALEALILSFNNIDALRQHIHPKARIHGIITDGGSAANVVPAHSAGNFLVRAADDTYLEELKKRVLNCFAGAATATGARLEYKWEEHRYTAMLNNLTIGGLFVKNMRRLGRKIEMEDPDKSFGSTDFGNVSQLVPGMHASFAVAGYGIPIHTPQFVEAAVSESGLNSMLQAAQGLAMTVADLIADPQLIAEVKKEFYAAKP